MRLKYVTPEADDNWYGPVLKGESTMLSDSLDRPGVVLPLECLGSMQQAIKRVEQDNIDQDVRITELSGMNRALEGRIRALEGVDKQYAARIRPLEALEEADKQYV